MHRDVVVIVGKAKAISKAVTVAEILKRSVPGLHQETTIALETSVDRWEPTEQQLDRYGMWGEPQQRRGRGLTHMHTHTRTLGRTHTAWRSCAMCRRSRSASRPLRWTRRTSATSRPPSLPQPAAPHRLQPVAAAQPVLQRHSPSCSCTACVAAAQPVLQRHSPCCSGTACVAAA